MLLICRLLEINLNIVVVTCTTASGVQMQPPSFFGQNWKVAQYLVFQPEKTSETAFYEMEILDLLHTIY